MKVSLRVTILVALLNPCCLLTSLLFVLLCSSCYTGKRVYSPKYAMIIARDVDHVKIKSMEKTDSVTFYPDGVIGGCNKSKEVINETETKNCVAKAKHVKKRVTDHSLVFKPAIGRTSQNNSGIVLLKPPLKKRYYNTDNTLKTHWTSVVGFICSVLSVCEVFSGVLTFFS